MKIKLYKHIVTNEDIRIDEKYNQFKKPTNIVKDNSIINILHNKDIYTGAEHNRQTSDYLKNNFKLLNGNHSVNKKTYDIMSSLYKSYVFLHDFHVNNVLSYNYFKINNFLYIGAYYIHGRWNWIIFDFLNNTVIEDSMNEAIEFKRPTNIVEDNTRITRILNDLLKNNIYTGANVTEDSAFYVESLLLDDVLIRKKIVKGINGSLEKLPSKEFDKILDIIIESKKYNTYKFKFGNFVESFGEIYICNYLSGNSKIYKYIILDLYNNRILYKDDMNFN